MKKLEEKIIVEDTCSKLSGNIRICSLDVIDSAIKTGMNATKWNLAYQMTHQLDMQSLH